MGGRRGALLRPALAVVTLPGPWPRAGGAWNIPTHVYAANLVLEEAFSTTASRR